MLCEVSQLQKDKYFDSTYMRYLRELQFRESRMMLARVLGEVETWSSHLMGTEFQFHQMRRLIGMEGGDGSQQCECT